LRRINEQIAAFGQIDPAGISPEVACIGGKPSSRAKIYGLLAIVACS
jgi:hypothetical protein